MDLDKLKDRGLMKWHGFFMPEHIKELQDIWQEDQLVSMPILEEYQIEQLEGVVHYSMEYDLPVEFKLITHCIQHQITGKVINIDHIKKQFKLKEMNNNTDYINFNEITDIKIVD
ncbi:YolD-like family protein [Heyndrickxia sp. NPDC080065]|uniref:YolD-like family protein n=1 Tax=Heyndrickxia sp. NPDC080065 TaxID=3390568 RepID=UPI003CFF6C9B